MPKLIVINQRGLTKLVPLPTGQTTVGRGSLNNIVIDAESVSRHHAVLSRDGSTVKLHDLGSRNGTYVNDVRVRVRRRPLWRALGIRTGAIRWGGVLRTPLTPPARRSRAPAP